MKSIVILLFTAFTITRPSTLLSQTLRESVSDSALADFVAVSAIKVLATQIARAAFGSQHVWWFSIRYAPGEFMCTVRHP